MKRWPIYIFFSLWGSLVMAQEPVFMLHDIGDFNTGKSVNAILQDHQSMIWLGTDGGLSRYDGTNCYPVSLSDSSSTFRVRSLFEDRRFNIWIGTASGRVFKLDQSRKLSEFALEEGSPKVSITSIQEDEKGYIWFSTYGEGVYVYDGSRLFNIDTDDGLSGVDVYVMNFVPGEGMWIGTDNGISICSFDDEKKKIKNLGLSDGLPDQIVTALEVDDLGQVWVGTFEFGVVRYTPDNQNFESIFQSDQIDEVTALTVFDQDELWIGTRTSGVWRFRPGQERPEPIDGLKQPRQGQVNDLLTDVEGNIWVGMDGGRLMSGIRTFESIAVDIPEIQAVFCDAKDMLWIGTQEGLYLLSGHQGREASPARIRPDMSLNITCMVQDDFGRLWIGTLDQGLFIYHHASGAFQHIGSIVGDGGITIMSMAISGKRIWVATLEGVVSYPRSKDIAKSGDRYFELLSDPWQSNLHFVFQVFVDQKDRIWFASDGNGVICLDGDRAVHYLGDSTVALKTVYSVCEDQQGHIWFNTPDQGLIEFDGQVYKPFGLEDGLRSLYTAGINLLGSGDMIITGEDGLTLMEPDRRHTMFYGEEIGIRRLEPGLNANTTTRRGHVYSCGRNVIYKCYSPKRKLSIHPSTQLTAVEIFDKKVDFQSEHHFP